MRRQGWRVKHIWGSDEDALQQCALTYSKCLYMYGEKARNAAHFMALYKTAITNHWNKFSVKDGRYREVHVASTVDDAGMVAWQDTDYSAGPMAAALAGASEELQSVLAKIFSAPSEVLSALLPSDEQEPDLVEMDQQFRRWFRLPHGTQVVSELKNLLSPEFS